MIDSSLLGSGTSLLSAWIGVLVAVAALSWVMIIYPKAFTRLRPVLFTVLGVPVLTVLILFVVRGFVTVERPLAHWVFDKDSAIALRFGMVLDPIAWIASISFFAALCGTTLRNRPNIRMVAAAAGAWVGLCWVASSKTIWTAILGVAVQGVSSLLPLFPASEEESESTTSSTTADERWMSATKRNWIALTCMTVGATALVTLGIHLDFAPEQSWTKLEDGFSTFVGVGLFLFGLLLLLTPAFFARAMQDDVSPDQLPSGEERFFSFDGALGWSALIILYRMHDSLKGTHWPLVISISSAVFALLSIPSMVFHERRRNAATQWMATLPALVGAILPLLPSEEAFVFIAGMLPVAAGLVLVFESPRSKAGVWLAGAFFLGVCGLMGWSSSAGIARFYSGIEQTPALQGPIALIWLLYGAIGWRIVIRGNTEEKDPSIISTGIIAGFLILLAFGPAISGRWSGGSIPEMPDWISGAKTWPWLEKFGDTPIETSWMGLAVSQVVWIVGILLGTFAGRSAKLFSFTEKPGRGKEITTGLFGLFWLRDSALKGLEAFGRVWSERVSGSAWEKAIPGAIGGIVRGFAKLGEWGEKITDPLTDRIYGKTVQAPAKFVRWIHGGNARLYGWFALVWILIFSLYLARS